MERLNMNSSSALHRFKRANGINLRTPNLVSGWIALCKIKKALNVEFTEEMFKAMEKVKYSKTTKVATRQDRIRTFMSRLDKLPAGSLKLIYRRYQDGGIDALLEELSKPMAILMRNPLAVEE